MAVPIERLRETARMPRLVAGGRVLLAAAW